MPPIRRTRKTAEGPGSPAGPDAETPSEAPKSRSTGRDPRGTTSSPKASAAERKIESLREQVEVGYRIVGTLIQPLGKWYPILTPLGEGLRNRSESISYSWLRLAQKEPKVMRTLESVFGFSAWGELLGEHAALGLEALPANQAKRQMEQAQQQTREAMLKEQMAMAEAMRQAQETPPDMPGRDTTTGGPGDTVRVNNSPIDTNQFTARPVPAPAPPSDQPVGPQTVGASKAGIVSPEQLGIQVPGEQAGAFPNNTEPPSGR